MGEDKKVKEKIDEDNADDNGDKSQHESELDNLFSDHIETANSSDDEDNDYNSRNEDGSEVEINKAFEMRDSLFEKNVKTSLIAKKWVRKHTEKGKHAADDSSTNNLLK